MNRSVFAGTGILARLIWRRDRLRLPLQVLGLAAFAVLFVPVFENLLNTPGGNRIFAAMMENPAMVAMVGPVYGAANYTTGAMYANMMLLFTMLFAAVSNLFLVTRHTRQDEELGRLEVIRSLPVGRLANLSATLLTALGANLVLALLCGLGIFALRGGGMTLSGCLLFGAAVGVTGLFFAAATAVFCQITTNNRSAAALTLLLLMGLYMLRAIGDVSAEVLARLSPLGLALRAQVFVRNQWWPIAVIGALALALAALALALASRRDLGRGLVAERPGRRHAAPLLASPLGLALRLLRTALITWAVVMFMLAAMYGSVFGDLDGFLASNTMLKLIFMANPNFSLAEQFITLLLTIMAMIGALPVLSFALRVGGEERSGYTEHVLGRAASRPAQMAAYFWPAWISSVLFQFLSALGFWSVGSLVLESAPTLPTFLLAAFAYLPAIWVLLGLCLALVAYLPGAAALAYWYLGFSFFSVYLGVLTNLPAWLRKLSPFGYIARYPVEPLRWLPLLVLTGLAALLVGLAFIGYRRRDVRTQ